jgi:hypothetical protein
MAESNRIHIGSIVRPIDPIRQSVAQSGRMYIPAVRANVAGSVGFTIGANVVPVGLCNIAMW